MQNHVLHHMFLIVGSSCAGKDTTIAPVLKMNTSLRRRVSCTTRYPRSGEEEGVHYHFLGREEFLNKVEASEFAEWAVVHGNHYGTLRANLDELLAESDLIFDIDVQGAMQIKANYPEAIIVLIMPENRAVLEERIRSRAGGETEEEIQLRLRNAINEEAVGLKMNDYIIENRTGEQHKAVNLLDWLIREICSGKRPHRMATFDSGD